MQDLLLAHNFLPGITDLIVLLFLTAWLFGVRFPELLSRVRFLFVSKYSENNYRRWFHNEYRSNSLYIVRMMIIISVTAIALVLIKWSIS
jgi:hypothetical protein